MKTNLLLLLAFASSTIFAAENVDQSLKVSPNGQIEIHNVRGEITLTGWKDAAVRVKGRLDDLVEKFIFESTDERTVIKVQLPRNSSFRSGEGSKLDIYVPRNSRVTFSGVATDLIISKLDGNLKVNSVSGDIRIFDTQGKSYVNSVSGDLDLSGLKGNIDIQTVSGDLTADVESEKITCSGVSSNIRIKTQRIRSANISTVSGDLDLFGDLHQDGNITLGSVSGDAFYHIAGELDASVSIQTAPGGEIVNQYSEMKPKKSFIHSQDLVFTAGRGSSSIRMSTVSGDIGLKNQQAKH